MPLQDATFAKARWIAPEGARDAVDGNQAAWFRLDFSLNEPKDARIRLALTAQTRYKLRLNGQPVTVGPRKGNAFEHFYEELELSDGLRQGENTLLVQVIAYAPLTNLDNLGLSPISVLTLPLPPALLAAGGLYKGGDCLMDFTTGVADWRAINDESIEWMRQPQAHYVGALERHHQRLRAPGMEGSAADWPKAQMRWNPQTNPYGEMPPMMLNKRTIPLLREEWMEFTRQMPCEGSVPLAGFQRGDRTEIPANASVALELDAGVFTTGYTAMETLGGRGATVRIRYAECYRPTDENGRRYKAVRDEPCPGGLEDMYDELKPDGGRMEFESFWFRTFRFVRLEIETGEEPLTLLAPRYRRTWYPLDVKARVRSSSDWVEQLQDICVRTLECCMQETYVDCPYFEQLQYTSDTKLEMDFTYAISQDFRMARQVIEDFHRSMMPDGMLQSRTPSQHRQAIPQFALYWIHMLHNLYWQEKDAERIRRYRPTIDAVLDYFHRHLDEEGMVKDLGYWDFGDWAGAWKHGVPTAVGHGPSTFHNLVYAWTLDTAAQLMALTGRSDVAEEYRARAQAVRGSVRRRCFDPATGLLREGPEMEQYSHHAQAFGVLSGLFQGEEGKRALQAILQRKDAVPCSYPQQFYLLRALETAGLYGLSAPLWQRMIDLLPLHITTMPETPDDPRSDCHAWSALQLYDAPAVWLGVRPAAPGWEGIVVAPQPMPLLKDLQGSVPTPHGDVTVAWDIAEGKFRLRGQSPAGVPLTVCLPDGTVQRLENGGAFDMEQTVG